MAAIESFTAILVGDVLAARETLSAANTQVNRRTLVRASLAAVEGLVWLCRQHVRETAEQMGELTPLADMALREQSYTVTRSGEVIEALRYIPLATSIRLIAKQAIQLHLSLRVSFDDAGWSKMLTAIEIRNRITHPKAILDLDVQGRRLQSSISVSIG